jgi:hypothetical protein
MDWEIQGLSNQCAQCEGGFQDGDGFHSFLILSQEGLPKRNDFCERCFEKIKTSWEERADLYSYWHGLTKIIPPPPRAQPLPFEKFELLLRKYIVSKESRDQKFAYILTLLLERKKVLIHRDSILKEEESKRFLVYDHAQTGETFILEDPHLSLNQVQEVQKELKDVMDEEFQIETCEKR